MSNTATGPGAPPPPRPPLVELAAALLIVGGVVGLVGAVSVGRSLPAGSEAFLALNVLLDIGAIVAGGLVRTGRLWIVAVNYVAVLAFLDAIAGLGGSQLALVRGIASISAVVILIAHKSWFDAIGEWRAARAEAAARGQR